MASPPSKRVRLPPSPSPSPPPKSPNTSLSKNHPITSTTSLFTPFRLLGLVTNGIPMAIEERTGRRMVTCLGNSWIEWDGEGLGVRGVGPNLPEPITSLCTTADNTVFVAAGKWGVGRYLRGKEIVHLSTSKNNEEVGEILHFGNQLLGLEKEGRQMWVWDLSENELSTTIVFPKGFEASCVLHPATYLNKVIVGSKAGELAIWNIQTNTLLHTFSTNDLLGPKKIKSNNVITSLEQSPAVDVVGVGFADGTVLIYDIRLGETLLRVRMEGDVGGGIEGMAFRNDNQGYTLATASSTGHLAIFDLGDKARLLHVVRAAHEGPVSTIRFLQGQPLMMTSGGDNSIKQWIFDTPESAPRILKQRSGHHAPPHRIRYYSDDGKSIITAGQDRALRLTSVVRDTRSFEFSQGSLAKKSTQFAVPISSLKLPPVSSISFSTARSKDWDDVLTTHVGHDEAQTWNVQSKRKGKWKMNTGDQTQSAKCACVTACGNFALFGDSTRGRVMVWNMQSGIHRKTLVVPGQMDGRQITGIETDALNQTVVVSTIAGNLYFFDFHTSKLQTKIKLPAGITQTVFHRDNGLLAAVCDDFRIRVVDIETHRTVREFGGFRGRLLDLAFSSDSRWIITSSMDSIIRTFDLPTGQLVDAFRTPTVATSLTFSPTGDFLATSHVDSLGVALWANRAQFAEVSLRSFSEREAVDLTMPTLQGTDEADLVEFTAPRNWDEIDNFTTPDKLSDELVTLSLMPRARWQTLLNLDTIRARNKPKEPPKAPEKAPFFLPTLPGVETRFDVAGTKSASDAEERNTSRHLDFGASAIETEFIRRLQEEDQDGDYTSFFSYLKSLSPAAADLEIRSLSSLAHLSLFSQALLHRLKSHQDFEAVQSFLALFLRVHGDVFIEQSDDELRGRLMELKRQVELDTDRVGGLVSYCLGALNVIRNAPI